MTITDYILNLVENEKNLKRNSTIVEVPEGPTSKLIEKRITVLGRKVENFREIIIEE